MTLIPSIVLPKNILAAINKRNGSIQVSPRLVRAASVPAVEVLSELKSGAEGLTEDEAQRRGRELQEAFAVSKDARSLPAGVGLSIGSAEVPADTRDVMAHVKLADDRMYADKRRTKAGEKPVPSA